jgi:hypothetical protein
MSLHVLRDRIADSVTNTLRLSMSAYSLADLTWQQ